MSELLLCVFRTRNKQCSYGAFSGISECFLRSQTFKQEHYLKLICVAASSLSFSFSLNDISEVGETKLKVEGF